MSAAEALKAARTVGIELVLDGDSLVLEAASEPPAVVLESLSRHKAEIIAMLRPGRDGSAEDWQAYFDKCAGISRASISPNNSERSGSTCLWRGKRPAIPLTTYLPLRNLMCRRSSNHRSRASQLKTR